MHGLLKNMLNFSVIIAYCQKYDGFGKITWMNASFGALSASAYAWNRTFTGQVLDSETGLMLYRNRYYNTGLGRFVTRDPIGYEAGDNSLYRYVGNMPTFSVDSYGQQVTAYYGPYGGPTTGSLLFPPPKPPKPKLPDWGNQIFNCVPSDCCSKDELQDLLNDIQNAIDNTRVFPLWFGPCQRWANSFSVNSLGNIKPSRCITGDKAMRWEPYCIIGGHAYFEFEICGGSVVRVENHARDLGQGRYNVTLPEECSKCPQNK